MLLVFFVFRVFTFKILAVTVVYSIVLLIVIVLDPNASIEILGKDSS